MVPILNTLKENMAKPLSGFEDINRYWDKTNEKVAVKILPGEFYVTKNDEIIVTVLGSCVSACIRDSLFGIGGMNHFMLPVSGDKKDASEFGLATRYGNYAMEHLINEIIKNGGAKKNLEVKLFGGGRVLSNMEMLDIGNKNISFVRDYIITEGLSLLAEDLGDIYPRKVIYYPLTGKVRIKKLRSIHNDTILVREQAYIEKIKTQPSAGEIELF